MKRLYGTTAGLKQNQTRRLEALYRRRIPDAWLITPEAAREMSRLSLEIRRQIGLLIDRQGKVSHVIVGDPQKIVIPELSAYRTTPGRLKGLRCVHTHLKDDPLSQDDLIDLALLRLDLMAVITVGADGLPRRVHYGHILPGGSADNPYQIYPAAGPGDLNIGCDRLIAALESEFSQIRTLHDADRGRERALLISVTADPKKTAEASMDELRDLAVSNAVEVVGRVIQHRPKVNARFLMGRGKLQEITLLALKTGAALMIFDQELNPSQLRSISDHVDLKIIDRTQLILDIFARRAQTREGKLQVELAQLKYLLPRLVVKNTAMSRLTGGIGGRGPGETKLEINRRRVRDRITRLGNALEQVRKNRKQQRARRRKNALPVISIIGYTNAGKSTLLNTLTNSDVAAANRLFATLDPSSRRLKFPRDMEVIVTDTVGFIRDLPRDLMVAFRATLEELENADLLLHVIDISNPRHEKQIESVETILSELNLSGIPVIRVLNKMDRVSEEKALACANRLRGITASAVSASTLGPLIDAARRTLAARGWAATPETWETDPKMKGYPAEIKEKSSSDADFKLT